MATQPDEQDDLSLDNETDADELEQENVDADERNDDAADVETDSDEEADEEVLTFGDDLAEERPDDSSVIKHLRNELKETREKLREVAAPKPEAIAVGPEPTMADCDYDEDKFKDAWREWNERTEAAERQKGEAERSRQRQVEEWEAEKKRFADSKASLPYADVEEAELTVAAALNEAQGGVLVAAAQQPAKLMYALYKHPAKLEALAKQTNLVKLAAEIGRLEKDLKMTKRRKTPDPETVERGSGSASAGRKDKHLEKLEKEAERTGERSKLIQYKKSLKEKK